MNKITFLITLLLFSFLAHSHFNKLEIKNDESIVALGLIKPISPIVLKNKTITIGVGAPTVVNKNKKEVIRSKKMLQCPVPTPTANVVVQPTCASPTGTIQVTSPLSTTAPVMANLFISEVTDAETGSLTYVEIYNGTGVSKDLSNYKLKIYNNGNSTTSCDLPLSGILANGAVNVIKVSNEPNEGGVVPNQVFPLCGGVNINDNIRLTTSSDILVDNWGRKDGVDFTPLNQTGYVYRRLATATPLPNTGWNPADWEEVDPEDYSNVGIYTAFSSTQYTYNVDGGLYQSSPVFAGLAPGDHVFTAKDVTNGGCISPGLTVTLNSIGLNTPVTTFSYNSPICSAASPTLTPNTSATGFTAGGTYSSTSGLIINATTGVVDLANSVPATYTVTYSVAANPAICLSAGSSQFILVINPLPTVSVSGQTVCQGQSATVTATPGAAGTYTYVWTVPSGVTNPGDVNSFTTTTEGRYSVKITNTTTGCVSDNASGIVVITPEPRVSVETSTVCEGQSATVTATPAISGTYNYVWTVPSGVTNPGNVATFETTVAGAYNVVATDAALGCSSQNESGIVAFATSFDFSIKEGCDNNNYMLEVIPSDNSFNIAAATFDWQYKNVSVGSGPTFNATVYLNSTSEIEQLPLDIKVNVTSSGCQLSHTTTLTKVFCDIQKGISPNGDGLNDSFDLHLLGVNKASIFNRFGIKVYSKTNYVNEWVGQSDNGNELPSGAYYYVLEFKNNNSKTGWIYINRETK